MRVSLKHLLELPNIDGMRIPIDTANLEKTVAYEVDEGEVVKHPYLTTTYGNQLLKKQVDKINIMPDNSLLQDILDQLRQKHPSDYPKPTGIYSLREIGQIVAQYEEMNEYSAKVREIFILHEIISRKNPASNRQQVIFPYNTRLNCDVVKKLLTVHSETERFDCLESENGILIVTIAKGQEDTLNSIMAATDLVARLEKHFPLDLAYSPQEAIEKFRSFNPRLVVFGNYKMKSASGAEEINDKARYAYLELKNHDIFMKSLFIDQVNLEENREKLAGEIMAAYRLPYNITKVESKTPFNEDEKKKLLNMLEKLNKQYCHEEFLKMSIQLKTLERTHMVGFLKSQLVNIHKLHTGPK